MIGLTAVVLCLSGVAYAAWPWLRRRGRLSAPAISGQRERELRHEEEREEYVKALRDWSLAAGEVEVESLAAVERAPTEEVGGG
jgi:hypothetical protein